MKKNHYANKKNNNNHNEFVIICVLSIDSFPLFAFLYNFFRSNLVKRKECRALRLLHAPHTDMTLLKEYENKFLFFFCVVVCRITHHLIWIAISMLRIFNSHSSSNSSIHTHAHTHLTVSLN